MKLTQVKGSTWVLEANELIPLYLLDDPVRVDLTFPEFLALYQKRFNALSKKRENIRMQRNKLYAHNDEQRILSNENLTDRHPILYPRAADSRPTGLDQG